MATVDAASVTRSISSSATGTTRARTISLTARTASATLANVVRSVACAGGSGTSRTIASVTMARVPSDPTINWVRS